MKNIYKIIKFTSIRALFYNQNANRNLQTHTQGDIQIRAVQLFSFVTSFYTVIQFESQREVMTEALLFLKRMQLVHT